MKYIYRIQYVILLLSVFISSCNIGQEKIENKTVKNPKNIILMIGDGMGVTHIYAAMTVNKAPLNLEKCRHIGFSKTYSASDYITDSGASGTAMATGQKTTNKAIGVDTTGAPLKTILEIAEENQLATGMVTTCAITHATPAAFIAHVPYRGEYEDIAEYFVLTEIDIFVGGGKKHFTERKDGRDLTHELKEKGYQVIFDLKALDSLYNGKIAALLADGHPPKYSESRGEMLFSGSTKAIEILDQNEDGFFLMIEASQIDWAGHDNDPDYIVEEMLDFDRTIGKVLEFAERDGNTLVIITADHETGGIGLNGGDINEGTIEAGFTTGSHTGVMVPVFAYGPGAEDFTGIYENTEIFYKVLHAYGFAD